MNHNVWDEESFYENLQTDNVWCGTLSEAIGFYLPLPPPLEPPDPSTCVLRPTGLGDWEDHWGNLFRTQGDALDFVNWSQR